MDPNAAVRAINQEYAKGLEPRDFDRVKESVAALAEWLEKGGFFPSEPISERAWKWGAEALARLNRFHSALSEAR